jgi:hypothetical protein
MNKIIILLTLSMLISCSSNSQNDIELTVKKLDLPVKLFYRGAIKDSSYIYLCFPKKIVFNNNASILNKVKGFKLNYYTGSSNNRYFPTYKFEDSLVYAKGFDIIPFTKDSLNIYYGYRLKESNSKLDSLITDKIPVQKKADWLIYNLPISQELKKWANLKVTDSMLKTQLHFFLSNKKDGFYYKSLDIELFED